MRADSAIAVRLGLLYAGAFFGIGLFIPFFPAWLAERGFTPFQIGLVAPILPIARVLLSSRLSGLADGRVDPTRLLAGCLVAAGIGYGLLMVGPGFALLCVIMVFIAVAQAPVMPLTDMLAIQALRANPSVSYGRARLWGSAAFMAAGIGGGAVIGSTGLWIVPPMLVVACAFAAWSASLAPVPSVTVGGSRSAAGELAVVPSRALLAVIVASASIQGSHAMLYAFGTISFARAGFGMEAVGLLWNIGTITEIVLFALFGRAVGPRFPAFAFMIGGGALGVIRWIGMGLEPTGAVLVVLMAMHAASFGMTHLGTIAAYSRLVPDATRGRALGQLNAVHALVNAALSALSGPIFSSLGGQGYWAMAPIALVGVIAAAAAWRLAPQPQSADVGG